MRAPVAIGARLEVRVVREGEVREKDDGGSHLHEGRDAEAVFVAVRVLEGEAGEIAVAGDDVGVDRPVPVASLDRAAGEQALQAVVDDAAGSPEDPIRIQAEMVRRVVPSSTAAVRDVHREPGGGELGLGEALRAEEGEIAGTRERAADSAPATIWPLLLVAHPGDDVGLDGHDVRPLGQGGELGGIEREDDVFVLEDTEAAAHGADAEGVEDLRGASFVAGSATSWTA
jgi:hypothetical protein